MRKVIQTISVIGLLSILFFVGLQSDALAFKTFLCTGGMFKDPVGLNKGSTEGHCVRYVRYETGIEYDACNNEAWTCFSKAQAAGYAVGQESKIGAIIVFDKVPGTELAVGHVGIVTDINGDYDTIRDSNWVADYTVGEHTEKVRGSNSYKILGYIYCDGGNNSSENVVKVMRIVGGIGWYPGNKTCVNAQQWFRIDNGEAIATLKDESACYQVGSEYINSILWHNILFGNDLPQSCSEYNK